MAGAGDPPQTGSPGRGSIGVQAPRRHSSHLHACCWSNPAGRFGIGAPGGTMSESDGAIMRILAALPWSAVAGIVLTAGTLAPRVEAPPHAAVRSQPEVRSQPQPFPAGDAPAFLLASVQPLDAPAAWRII